MLPLKKAGRECDSRLTPQAHLPLLLAEPSRGKDPGEGAMLLGWGRGCIIGLKNPAGHRGAWRVPPPVLPPAIPPGFGQ